MGRCDRLITSRQQQRQPLGIVAGSFNPDRAAFHVTGPRLIGAAAHGVMKIGQTKIALVIGTEKPIRRYAANTLSARYIHAKAVCNRLLSARVCTRLALTSPCKFW